MLPAPCIGLFYTSSHLNTVTCITLDCEGNLRFPVPCLPAYSHGEKRLPGSLVSAGLKLNRFHQPNRSQVGIRMHCGRYTALPPR